MDTTAILTQTPDPVPTPTPGLTPTHKHTPFILRRALVLTLMLLQVTLLRGVPTLNVLNVYTEDDPGCLSMALSSYFLDKAKFIKSA